MKRLPKLILIIAFAFPCLINAQSIRMDHISSLDGLFGDTVHKVFRDSKGYLWIIGVKGVARYDGRHFMNFTQHDDKSNQFIQGVSFYSITEDPTGTIWVAGDGGLQYYCSHQNTFKKLAGEQIPQARFVGCFNDSCLWVSCPNHNNFVVNAYNHQVIKRQEQFTITSTIIDSVGQNLQAISGGYVLKNCQDTLIHIPARVEDMCFTPKGNLFFGTSNGVYFLKAEEIEKHSKNLQHISAFNGELRLTGMQVATSEYFENSIWVGTRNGLNQIKLDDDELPLSISYHFNEPHNTFSLISNRVNDILLDHEGILWLATHGGLSKIDPKKLWFYSHQKNPLEENSLHDNLIFPISGNSKGVLWFGSYTSGLSRYDSKLKQFTWYNQNNSPLSSSVIRYIYTDLEDDTWIIVHNNLYLAADEKLTPAVLVDKNNKVYKFKNNYAIIQHPNKSYWLGTNGKLLQLKRVGKSKFIISAEKSEKTSTVIRLFIDKQERIWAGTNNGIYVFEPEQNKLIFEISRETYPVLQSGVINSIVEDSEENIWLGTTNGLYRIEHDNTFHNYHKELTIKGFFEANGLGSNYITGLLSGTDGKIWISSWKGVFLYDPACIRLCRFTPFSYSDGIVSEKFNRHGTYHDTISGNYYFGGIDGVNYFKPIDDKEEENVPEILFNEVLVDGNRIEFLNEEVAINEKTLLVSELKNLGTIKQLSLSFASSSLLKPEKQVFAWRLIGRDERLQYTRDGELLIKNITPGTYDLKLRTVTKDGRPGPAKIIRITVVSYLSRIIIGGVITIIVLTVLFFALRKRKVNEPQPKSSGEKYAYSNLTSDESSQIIVQLKKVMEEDKPFLKSDFKAADLANMLGLTTVKLSQILNDSLHTKFYDFVNSYRVNEFVELLEKGESEHLTLTAMAELCGFSSKSTFYRAFNNEKGMTPAKFAKTLKENS